MPLINGHKFKKYELDTIDSVKARIASKLNTLPEYLYFRDELFLSDLDYSNKNNIIVEDLLIEIKESAEKNSYVVDLINNIIKKNNKLNIKDKVLPYWFGYNKILMEKYKKQGDFVLQKITEELIGNKIKNIQTYNIKELWKNNTINIKKLQDNIEKNIKIVKKQKKIFKDFTLTKANPSTDFNTEYIVSTLTLESKNKIEQSKLSLLELFNESILTPYVPFITTQNFYKIAQDFIPSDEWVSSSSDSIILKVASRLIFGKENTSNYTDTIIKVDDKSHTVTSEIMVYSSTRGGNVSKDEYTKRSINVFKNINLYVKESKESKISGNFYFPNKKIDKYIFSDLVMNDNLFNNLLKIDEHESATKKKTYLFIQFYHPNTGLVKANITPKIANKTSLTDDQNTELFPDKSNYISVKVKEATNMKAVVIFKNILGKLLSKYDKKAIDVIKFYSQYIPDFGDDEEEDEEDEEKEKKISEIAPEIFVSNYTRNCAPFRMPTVISEEDSAHVKENGQNVIKFPRDIPADPRAVKFPNDGENQNYYVCNNKPYKYVGLTKNKLRNSDKFPYVPCCFKNDQSKKPKYLNYYEGQEVEPVGKIKQQDIIKTQKILDNNRFGSLPYNIDNLFNFIYPNQTYEYIRKGVFRNEHSFLNCVMEALDESTNILSITDENEREVVLIDTRNILANKTLAVLCRQEMYDKTTDEIIEILKNPNEYLDPKLFIHLLEEYFECNIFIFTKQTMLSDGEMILPRHLQAYYKHKNNYPCIYIYEHTGIEKQCELIIKYNTVKEEDQQDLFTYEEAKNIRNLFSKLKEANALDKSIRETVMPIPSHIQIISQWIDSYGKTRRLDIKYDDHIISLITSPVQPIKVKETKSQSVKKTPLDVAMKFIKELAIELESQTIVNKKTHELNGILGNVKVSIPIKETDTLDIPEKDEGVSFPINRISALEQYNKNKKTARYLMEYTIWIYSKYLYDEDIKEITEENITTFAKSYFKIDPYFQYGYVSKAFKVDNLLMENGLIVVHDEDTLKRLIYFLRLSCKRNRDNVIEYHKKVFIQNYYVDITDFTQYPNQVILFGEESVEHWINENNLKYILHNTIQIGNNLPYFFKNTLIDNKIYLAQNTSSLEKASDIAITWLRKGYNKGIVARAVTPVSFTLYSYINAYNITKYDIQSKSSSHKIKIIGYKINNKPYYIALLNLS
jgi:hypothetical protein